MGHMECVEAEIPFGDIVEACVMGLGHVIDSDGHACVCIILMVHGPDGQHLAVSQTLSADDVTSICDALQMLNSVAGIGDKPDGGG